MSSSVTFVDRLPSGNRNSRWSIETPSEGYQAQEEAFLAGQQRYLDLHLRLESTETRALLRVYLTPEQLVPDALRDDWYRLLSNPEGEFIDEDARGTANLAIIRRGFVRLSGSAPDTPAGTVWITAPGSSTPTR